MSYKKDEKTEIDYESLVLLSCFSNKVDNLIDYSSRLFGTIVDLSKDDFLPMKAFAEKRIVEVENDINKIKQLLSNYVPIKKI